MVAMVATTFATILFPFLGCDMEHYCELNYIETYWGAAKRYVRQHCDYTWKDLQENIPRAFDSISLKQIRKYALRSVKYMECCRKGLTVLQAEYALKKYKSQKNT